MEHKEYRVLAKLHGEWKELTRYSTEQYGVNPSLALLYAKQDVHSLNVETKIQVRTIPAFTDWNE